MSIRAIMVGVVTLVMLPQQILPIIIPVGSPNNGVDVFPGGLLGTKRRHATLVVELDQYDGTVNAVVIDAVLGCSTNPREMRAIEVSPYLAHFQLSATVTHVAHVLFDESPFQDFREYLKLTLETLSLQRCGPTDFPR